MKSSRWVVVATAMAVVVLVSPAIGAGKNASGPLAWSQGGVTVTSYELPTLAPRSRESATFRLTNWGGKASGTFSIDLTGSRAFSIKSTRCSGKNLGIRRWCRVTVAYRPREAGARDSAVLTATRAHGTVASLALSGCSASGYVYWNNGGTVNEALTGEGCITTVKALATGQDPESLAAYGKHVYWTDTYEGTVNEATVGSGLVATLATDQDNPTSVAVDGKHVVWINDGLWYGNGTDGTVNEVPVGGGDVTTLASGQADPRSVAVHGSHVVWINVGDGTVNEVPVGGGTVTTLAGGQSWPTAVAVDGSNVYWATIPFHTTGTVNEVPVGGGAVTTLATGQSGLWMAVYGTNVYWVNYYDGTVNEVPVGGGTLRTVATGLDGPGSAVLGRAHVYWATNDDPSTVKEAPLGHGTVHIVARDQGWPVTVAVGS